MKIISGLKDHIKEDKYYENYGIYMELFRGHAVAVFKKRHYIHTWCMNNVKAYQWTMLYRRIRRNVLNLIGSTRP